MMSEQSGGASLQTGYLKIGKIFAKAQIAIILIIKFFKVGHVENETHFILSCQKYTTECTTFLNRAQNLCPNFSNIPTDEQKLIYLMSNEDELLLQTFSEFLHDIYTKRLALENNNQ